MSIRYANAMWEGDLKRGHGSLRLESGALEAPYSFKTRFGEGSSGTNPEELIAAAHAGCFTMALANILSEAGHVPRRLDTTAKVYLAATNGGFEIPKIELHLEADVPGLDDAKFAKLADVAKRNCPVSKALAGVEIVLEAQLKSNA